MRGSLAAVAALSAILAGSIATAQAAAGGHHFELALPKPKTGAIREIVVTVKLAPGSSVSGDPFIIQVGNIGGLPSYIRAAAAVDQPNKTTFDIFVAINAPKGIVHARMIAHAADDALELIVAQAGAVFPAGAAHYDLKSADACKLLKAAQALRRAGGLAYEGFGVWSSPPQSIFDYVEADDAECK